MSNRTQLVLRGLLLLLGAELWLMAGDGLWGMFFQVRWTGAAMVVASVPWVFRPINRALDAIRNPTPRWRAMVAVLIALFAAAYFIFTGFYQHRELAPRYHDEFVYLLQSRLLTTGRLWTAAHPLADFFDTLYVFVQPVYAPKYFPGVAMMLAPGMKLGVPFWAIMAVIAGGAVGLFYRVICELIDGLAAALAALGLVCLEAFRSVSLMAIGQAPVILLGLAVVWCWLRWRAQQRARWMAIAGLLAGWAAITRPVDALCFTAPVAVAVVADLWRAHRQCFSRGFARVAMATAIGLLPIVILQGSMNLAITGSLSKTPFGHYNELYQPAVKLGFADPASLPRPQTTLPEKLALYEELVIPSARTHRERSFQQLWLHDRLPNLIVFDSPHPFLMMLAPAGMAALLARRRGWVMLAPVPLFAALYYFYPFFLPHYIVVTAPAVLTCLGAAVVWLPAGTGWARKWLTSLLTVAFVVLSVTGLAELNSSQHDEGPFRSELREIDRQLAALPGPSVVMFRFAPTFNIHSQPVYNIDAANPDDARVIRVHDRGSDNARLYCYYAARNPERSFYRYDEKDNTLTFLGKAGELATASTQPATQSLTQQ